MTNRTATISLRVRPEEKDTLAALARIAGLTLSEYILQAAHGQGVAQVEAITQRFAEAFPTTPARRPKRDQKLSPLKTPSMPGPHGESFQHVAYTVAKHMHSDAHTVALVLSHAAEAIGDWVASGRVFRWPGFMVAGPYRATRRDGSEQIFPRLQSNPPLTDHVRWNCPPGAARNTELEAHLRRTRSEKPFSSFQAVQSSFRHAVMLQEKRIIGILESRWRDECAVLLP